MPRRAIRSLAVASLVLAAGVFAVRATAAAPTTTVSFRYEPATPLVNQTVTFTSTSTVSGGNRIISQLWDLNGDGVYGDATGDTATRSFAAAGQHIVGLRVIDKHPDHVHVATRTVNVVNTPPENEPPLASFAYYPGTAAPGQVVNFYSTSTDPDSPIAAQTWDLDGNGSFDDANGPTAARSFPLAGTYTVSLRVADTHGASSTTSASVVVEDPAHPTQTDTGAQGLRLLSPFPIVRLSGNITEQGIRVRRLTVSNAKGVRIILRCSGHRCPFKKQTIRARSARVARNQAHIARALRVRRLEGKVLRIGLRLQLYITKPHMIGKYTRFRIRKNRPPARTDRCLMPKVHRPVRCPSA